MKVSPADVAFIGRALTVANRQWRNATQELRDQYSLGPRGPWILGIIYHSEGISPHELAGNFQCGRSLITAELTKLIEAGLVVTRKSETDRRHLELGLTPKGRKASERLGESIVELIEGRLSSYQREELLYCARLLLDFGERPGPPNSAAILPHDPDQAPRKQKIGHPISA